MYSTPAHLDVPSLPLHRLRRGARRAATPPQLSSRVWANQFRLLRHAATYWLLDTPRRGPAWTGVARLRLQTPRLGPIKIGGWVRGRADGIALPAAGGYPGALLWRLLAARRSPLAPRPHETSGQKLASSRGLSCHDGGEVDQQTGQEHTGGQQDHQIGENQSCYSRGSSACHAVLPLLYPPQPGVSTKSLSE
jgi:hypothetical protein